MLTKRINVREFSVHVPFLYVFPALLYYKLYIKIILFINWIFSCRAIGDVRSSTVGPVTNGPAVLYLGGSGLSRQFLHIELTGSQSVNKIKITPSGDTTIRLDGFTILYYNQTLQDGTPLYEFKTGGVEVAYSDDPEFPCSLYAAGSTPLPVENLFLEVWQFK